MNSDQAHQRAERNFKKEERARDARQAMIEHEVQIRATRAKTALTRKVLSRSSAL